MELILDKPAAGKMVERILQASPPLTQKGIRVALALAAQALRADVVYPVQEAAGLRITGDENVDREIVVELRGYGPHVTCVAETGRAFLRESSRVGL